MSAHNHDPSLKNRQESCLGTEKLAWERPTLRRLAANKAQTGKGTKHNEGAVGKTTSS